MAAIVQAFDIPPEIQLGLAQGIYKVWGGVVRWAVGPNKGKIVKHLKPIDISEVANAANVNPSLGKKAFDIVKNNKKMVAVGAGVVIAIATGAGVIYHVTHKKSKEELEFRLALNNYIDAVRNGSLNIEKIDALVTAMDVLKTRKDYEKIKLELSTRDLDILINRLHEYTVKLAEDNNIKLSASETEKIGADEDNIVCLKCYLNAQRRILKEAA